MISDAVGASPEPWGTSEELLLAYAVSRHGDQSWESVATEIQTRVPRFHIVTPFHCQHKYHEINRRYLDLDFHSPHQNTAVVPWIDHLRQLRLAELRREVQNYDTSIIFLQSKLRKLEQERDAEANPDLKIRISGALNRRVSDEQRPDPETDADCNAAPPHQDDQSFNESNSAHTRSDNAAGAPLRCSDKEGVAGELPELSTGRMREQEEAAPATETESSTDVSFFDTEVQMESRPLDEIFDAVNTHPLCSVFTRQLDGHEMQRYGRLIRQPMGMEMIRGRVHQGGYLDFRNKFFRDMLLLFNNAVVFFDRSSPEFAAAVELRRLFSREVPPKSATMSPPPSTEAPPESPETFRPPEDPLPAAPPISVCRKRTSLGAGKLQEAGSEEAPATEEVLASALEWKKPIRAVMKRRSRERRKPAVVMPEPPQSGVAEGANGGGGGRVKQRSGSGNNGSLLETLKGLTDVCGGGTRQGKGGRVQKEEAAVAQRKRGVGRPPKKTQAATSQVQVTAPAAQKRVREGGEGDALSPQRWRKRLRK